MTTPKPAVMVQGRGGHRVQHGGVAVVQPARTNRIAPVGDTSAATRPVQRRVGHAVSPTVARNGTTKQPAAAARKRHPAAAPTLGPWLRVYGQGCTRCGAPRGMRCNNGHGELYSPFEPHRGREKAGLGKGRIAQHRTLFEQAITAWENGQSVKIAATLPGEAEAEARKKVQEKEREKRIAARRKQRDKVRAAKAKQRQREREARRKQRIAERDAARKRLAQERDAARKKRAEWMRKELKELVDWLNPFAWFSSNGGKK